MKKYKITAAFLTVDKILVLPDDTVYGEQQLDDGALQPENSQKNRQGVY